MANAERNQGLLKVAPIWPATPQAWEMGLGAEPTPVDIGI